MTIDRHCAGCRAVLAEGDRFCASCGRATRDHARKAQQALGIERRRHSRAALAIAIGFVVPVIVPVLALLGVADDVHEDAALVTAIVIQSLAVLLGTLGILCCLGRDSVRDALPLRTSANAWLLAPAVAALSFGVAMAWSRALMALAQASTPTSAEALALDDGPSWLLGYAIVVAPILEETLCRGALWAAVSRIGRDAQTLTVTAAVFALLHALNGGFFLELPHRFVSGLCFGWLRLRTGSVAPPIVAHALHNAAVMFIPV